MEFKVGKSGVFTVLCGKPALVVIDMQHDFLDSFFAEIPSNLIPNIQTLLRAARAARVPVIHTKEWHRPGKVDMGSELYPGTGLGMLDATEDASVPVHCVEGTRGAEIIEELAPIPGEYIIHKKRFNAFLGTDLDISLRNLKVETLIVSGIMAECCILFTSGEAHQLDYHVRLVEDCTAGATKELTAAGINVVRTLTTGIPITLDMMLRALEEYRTVHLFRGPQDELRKP